MNKSAFWIIGVMVSAVVYIPVMLMLAKMPIHDGSELPSIYLLVITLIISILLGFGLAKTIKMFVE